MKPTFTLLLFFISISTCHAQWKGFETIKTYPINDVAALVHTKDLTGDKVPDLSFLYSAANTNWGILEGKGDGGFTTTGPLIKEDNYFPSDIADFNRDGYPDMVISSYWANGFLLYFGQPSGELQKGPFMYMGVHGSSVKCVDINKDDIIDIVGTTSGSGQTIALHVFIGKGNGTFQNKQTFHSVLHTGKEILITDKNNDGLLDVVSTSSFPWLVIFVQKPDGSFEPTYHPTYTTAQAVLSDVNQDGKEDLLLLYASFDNNPNSDSLIIKLNNGTDYFTPSIQVHNFENKKIRPWQVKVGDMNRDGFDDLFFTHIDEWAEFTDTVFYMLGKGNAQFDDPVAVKMPAPVRYITVADLNNDKWLDLVVSCYNKTINVLLSRGEKMQQEKGQLLVYPNPAASYFFIESSIKTQHNIRLYNAAGQLVLKQTTSSTKTRIPAYGLPFGLYYVEIRGKEIKAKKPILVQ